MRTTFLRLAQNISAVPIPEMTAAVQSLLPPLVLYKRLLRAHKKHLPVEMKVLGKYLAMCVPIRRRLINLQSSGDDYVKAEFRRTKTTDNPLHIMGFLSE